MLKVDEANVAVARGLVGLEMDAGLDDERRIADAARARLNRAA
jgi:hypothetical protein